MNDQFDLLSLSFRITPKNKDAFINWQTELHKRIAAVHGFVSLEILSPVSSNDPWKTVERFYDASSAILWKESSTRIQLIRDLKKIALKYKVEETFFTERNSKTGVTEVFITNVSKDMEKTYLEWIARVHQVEVQFPGFRGVYVQSPSHNGGQCWITLLQFDTPQNLDNWLISPERKTLLIESESLISSFESHRMISPYGNWFSSSDKGRLLPSEWKQTMVVLLVLFPIVMMQFKFLSPLTKGFDISLGTFIANSISVTLISWPFMPVAIKYLAWWLLPKNPNPCLITLLGVLLMCLLYAIEVAIFWSFV